MLEPLQYVQKYEVIDYEDLEGAQKGLQKLSENLVRDEEQVERQRSALAQKYGLNAMIENLLQVYSEHGITAEK